MAHPKILWYLFHPNRTQSRGNAALLTAAEKLPHVTLVDAYAEFGHDAIDVPLQQTLLREHDLVVFQHPFYWYSCPSLMKEWLDRVLTYGFAYPPTEGRALHGKHWQSVVTTGGPGWSYQSGGYNNFSMSELLRPFQATANLCGMKWHPPFVVHGVLPGDFGEIKPISDTQLAAQAQELAAYLENLDLETRRPLEPVLPPHFLGA